MVRNRHLMKRICIGDALDIIICSYTHPRHRRNASTQWSRNLQYFLKRCSMANGKTSALKMHGGQLLLKTFSSDSLSKMHGAMPHSREVWLVKRGYYPNFGTSGDRLIVQGSRIKLGYAVGSFAFGVEQSVFCFSYQLMAPALVCSMLRGWFQPRQTAVLAPL